MEKKAKNFDKIVAEWKSKIDSLQAELDQTQAWLPDGYSQIFRSHVFGPSGLKGYGCTCTTLRCKI